MLLERENEVSSLNKLLQDAVERDSQNARLQFFHILCSSKLYFQGVGLLIGREFVCSILNSLSSIENKVSAEEYLLQQVQASLADLQAQHSKLREENAECRSFPSLNVVIFFLETSF